MEKIGDDMNEQDRLLRVVAEVGATLLQREGGGFVKVV